MALRKGVSRELLGAYSDFVETRQAQVRSRFDARWRALKQPERRLLPQLPRGRGSP